MVNPLFLKSKGCRCLVWCRFPTGKETHGSRTISRQLVSAKYWANATYIVKYHGSLRQTMEKSGIFTSESAHTAYTKIRVMLPSLAKGSLRLVFLLRSERNCEPAQEETMASKRLTIPQRKEIFQALVATQDMVHNVRKSYEVITEKFEITESQLKQIEDEGLDKEWPPLCELMEEAV
jgi:hypothetical protein